MTSLPSYFTVDESNMKDELRRGGREVEGQTQDVDSFINLKYLASLNDKLNNQGDPTIDTLEVSSFKIFNKLRIEGQLCNVIIQVDDGTRFYVHRIILSGEILSFYYFKLNWSI
jgi:hypothetical protein